MNIEELKQRAAAGDAEAMCDLGMAYFHGEGVEQNTEKAVELLQASVDAGDEYAPLLLGQMYLYSHINDEDAGYNGMRFLCIAAARGAEGVEKEIAEKIANAIKEKAGVGTAAHGLCFFLPVEMSTLTIHEQELIE